MTVTCSRWRSLIFMCIAYMNSLRYHFLRSCFHKTRTYVFDTWTRTCFCTVVYRCIYGLFAQLYSCSKVFFAKYPHFGIRAEVDPEIFVVYCLVCILYLIVFEIKMNSITYELKLQSPVHDCRNSM